MGSLSKEDNVLRLILENSPFKEWHFEEIVKKAKVTKAVANKWLKKYQREGLLKHVKEKRKFSYFTVGGNSAFYYSLKKVYALNRLHESGILSKLLSLKNAKTVIIFGSVIKGDWYKDSDVDIFVFGDASDFNKNFYESRLYSKIEMHIFKDKNELKNVKTGLIKNIINGYIIKGSIQDIVEVS
jgi:predicted nucleotidyltransferase